MPRYSYEIPPRQYSDIEEITSLASLERFRDPEARGHHSNFEIKRITWPQDVTLLPGIIQSCLTSPLPTEPVEMHLQTFDSTKASENGITFGINHANDENETPMFTFNQEEDVADSSQPEVKPPELDFLSHFHLNFYAARMLMQHLFSGMLKGHRNVEITPQNIRQIALDAIIAPLRRAGGEYSSWDHVSQSRLMPTFITEVFTEHATGSVWTNGRDSADQTEFNLSFTKHVEIRDFSEATDIGGLLHKRLHIIQDAYGHIVTATYSPELFARNRTLQYAGIFDPENAEGLLEPLVPVLAQEREFTPETTGELKDFYS